MHEGGAGSVTPDAKFRNLEVQEVAACSPPSVNIRLWLESAAIPS